MLTKELTELDAGFCAAHDGTLAIGNACWRHHLGVLIESTNAYFEVCSQDFATYVDQAAIRDQVEKVRARFLIASGHLVSLGPFSGFDYKNANEVHLLMQAALRDAADHIARGVPYQAHEAKLRVKTLLEGWQVANPESGSERLSSTFKTTSEPLTGEGDFSPGIVLNHYAHDSERLWRVLIPHLLCMGVMPPNLLSAISVVGWVVGAPDPVVAFAAMESLRGRLETSDPLVVESVRRNLELQARSMRQARKHTLIKIHALKDSDDLEIRALLLAEAYKKIVEGPVRNFGWSFCCLALGRWQNVPTLTPVRERMASLGGYLESMARMLICSDMRNGEAHEQIEWDGFSEQFVAKNSRYPFAEVYSASLLGLSFDSGCKAAVAAFESQSAAPVVRRPSSADAGRLEVLHRIQAAFGTNEIQLIRDNSNSKHAKFWIKSFEMTDVNPLTQAMLHVASIEPRIETFEVRIDVDDQKVFYITKEELKLSYGPWDYARRRFHMMPISTFLPANMQARCHFEGPSRARRAAAWIAVDDAVDALERAKVNELETVTGDALEVLRSCLRVVHRAVAACLKVEWAVGDTRLSAIRLEAESMSNILDEHAQFTAFDLDHMSSRMHDFWSAWGPVQRFPGVEDISAPDGYFRQPGMTADALIERKKLGFLIDGF